MTSDDQALERARAHVKQVRDFFYHLMTYLVVSLLFVIVDRSGGPNDGFLGLDWAYWPILFWGLGVMGHAVSAFFGEYRVRSLYRREKGREPAGR